MLAQLNRCSTRARAFRPIDARRSGSSSSTFTAAARSFENCSGCFGSTSMALMASGVTSRPVSPCSTTSGMPPTAEATTGVSHAMASRLMIPNGS